MTERNRDEYRELRATIRERSTARLWIALAGFTVWSALLVAALTLIDLPVLTLVPLLVLSLTFELVFSIHTAVERVGRYLQVFFEDAVADRGWEHQAMEFGRRFPGAGPDPLFCTHFWTAIVLNLLPATAASPSAGPLEWAVVGVAHAAVAFRIHRARHRAAGQRALDLARFTALKDDPAGTGAETRAES